MVRTAWIRLICAALVSVAGCARAVTPESPTDAAQSDVPSEAWCDPSGPSDLPADDLTCSDVCTEWQNRAFVLPDGAERFFSACAPDDAGTTTPRRCLRADGFGTSGSPVVYYSCGNTFHECAVGELCTEFPPAPDASLVTVRCVPVSCRF